MPNVAKNPETVEKRKSVCITWRMFRNFFLSSRLCAKIKFNCASAILVSFSFAIDSTSRSNQKTFLQAFEMKSD